MSFSLRRIVLVGLVLVWAGCGQEASESSSPQADRKGRPGVSLDALIEAGIDRPPGTDSLPVLDRLRPPLRIEREPHENRHVRGQVDTLRTYVYRGMKFTVYEVAGASKEIMESLTVVDSRYETEKGLRVGLSREESEVLLDSPDQAQGDTLVYELGSPVPNFLRVSFEKNRISRLEWSFYVD